MVASIMVNKSSLLFQIVYTFSKKTLNIVVEISFKGYVIMTTWLTKNPFLEITTSLFIAWRHDPRTTKSVVN